MNRWVALPRAINLGTVNKVPMPQLRQALTDAGFSAVASYLQSGNLVVDGHQDDPSQVAALVERVLAEAFDVDTRVIVRSPEQIRAVLDWNPYPEAASERPSLTMAVFLTATVAPGAAEAAGDISPARFQVRGADLVLDRHGPGTAGILAPLLRRLGADGTARNWRTLRAIADLTDAS